MEFRVEIQAAKEVVWKTLWDDITFRDWADLIDEGMYMVGELKQGNEVQFISSVNGYGVTSLVLELVPNEFVAFVQINDTQDTGQKDREKQWTGSKETYSLNEKDGVTTLTLTSDVPPELEEIMADNLQKALERVKELAERAQR